MAKKFRYDAFISYSSEDEDVVNELVERLKNDKIRVWFDTWEVKVGEPFSRKIEKGLENSRKVLVVMSRNASSSEWVKLESHTKFVQDPNSIIPVRIDDAPVTGFLATLRHADWRKKSEKEYSELIEALRPKSREIQKFTYSSNEFEQQLFCANEDEIFNIAFSNNRRWLAAGSEEQVLIWDISDGKFETREAETASFPHPDYVYAVAFSPDSKFIITAGQDKIVRKWSLEEQKLVLEQPEGGSQNHTEAIYSVVFSRDGETVWTGSYDGSVATWDAASLDYRRKFPVGGRVSCIAYSPAGEEIIAIASHNNNVVLFRLKDGSLKTLSGDYRHQSSVEAVVFSPDGRSVASCGLDKAVILWGVETETALWRREGNQYHQYLVKSIAISPDGKTLASASWDKKINLWDIEGNHYQALPYSNSPWHEDWIWSVAFSADGKILASGGSDGRVVIWRNKPRDRAR